MINVSVYHNAENLITGFKVTGHADYSEYGSDIVCAAVSALVINTINSINHFTSDKFRLDQDEHKGYIEFHVMNEVSGNSNLLLSSLVLGLQGVAEEYTDQYIRLTRVKSQ